MIALRMRSAMRVLAYGVAAAATISSASAATVDFAWDYGTTAVSGFVLYCGSVSKTYDTRIDVGNALKYSISGLTEGSNYYCSVAAYDAAKVESPRSSELAVQVPYAKPVVNFAASPASGVAPLGVSFANTTTGQVTTWLWSFGDGATASTKAASHTYSTPGSYTVTLTATGPGGTASKSGVLVQATAPSTSTSSTGTSSSGTTTSSTGSTSGTTTSGSTSTGSTSGTTGTTSGTTSTSTSGVSQTSTGTTTGTTSTSTSSGSTSTGTTSGTGTTTTTGTTSTTSSGSVTKTVPRGLVAAYGFDQGSGSVVVDSSGQGNNGIITNAAWTTGRYGGALKFSGNGWVTINSAPSIELSSAMTIEAWVKPDQTMYGWKDIVMKQTSWSTDQNNAISYYLCASSQWGLPVGGVVTSAEQMIKGPSLLVTGKWSYLATTYDGSSLRLYVNGALVATRAVSGAITPGKGPLRIGGDGIWGEYFHGSIDEVRVYNRALSQDEIGLDMATPISRLGK